MTQAEKSRTVTDYLATLPKQRRERREAIDRLVKILFPKAMYDFEHET